MPVETLRPVGTVSNTMDIYGGAPTAHEATDDGVGAGDATGVEAGNIAKSCNLDIDNPSDAPDKTVNWTLVTRIRHTGDPPDELKVEVKEGASVRATDVLTADTTTDDETALHSFDPAAVVDTDLLRILITATGGAIGTVHVADVELVIATVGTPGDSDSDATGTGRKLGRPEKPEGDSPAEQSATLTPNPKPPQFVPPEPVPPIIIIDPPITIQKLNPISESLEEEELDAPTMPTPMPEPPLKFD